MQVLVLAVLTLTLVGPDLFSPAEAQEPETESETVWDLGTLEPGRVFPTEIAARNVSCRGSHDFTIEVRQVSWLRITGPYRLERVGLGEAKKTSVEIDTRGLEEGRHEGTVAIHCVTCPPPPVCSQNIQRILVRLEIPGSAGEASGTEGPCECAELRSLAEAAGEALRRAEAVLEEAEGRHGELMEKQKEAEKALEEAEERVEDLDRYFDDSSWIEGEKGRITRGDLALLREARSEVYEQWRAGEISAEEAAEAWEEIDPDELEELRAEKARAREAAKKVRREAADETAELGDEGIEAADEIETAREEVRAAREEAESARELLEACLAECRADLTGRIADHRKALDDLDKECGPIPWDEIRRELQGIDERAGRLGKEIAEAKEQVDEHLGSLLRAQQLHELGKELPAMPTGLWDWGESVGRTLGRPFGLEELGGEVGEATSAGVGAAAEGFAGFPVATDAVKAVGSAYKGVFGALSPDSVSLGRCIEKAFSENAQWKRQAIVTAWKEARRLDDAIADLAEATRKLEARRQEIGELTGELQQLGSEAPEAPAVPGPDASLEELEHQEGELRAHRQRMEERCVRQQKLLARLNAAIAAARGALGEIGAVHGTLVRIADGAALYREYLRRVGPLDCL